MFLRICQNQNTSSVSLPDRPISENIYNMLFKFIRFFGHLDKWCIFCGNLRGRIILVSLNMFAFSNLSL